MKRRFAGVLVPVYLLILFGTAFPQNPCTPPEVVYNRGAENLFTVEQEIYLGDVLAETIDKELSVIVDEASMKYLQSVGERVARHLPPNDIKFRFFIVDAPELNAFSVAGGRIYVTRKLISFVKSEDELAGILGHEMGHAVVRHTSVDFSRAFREILGVQKLEDREDVNRRVHDLLDRSRTKRLKVGKGHEDNQQLEADRIGVYAMAAAGYDPDANVTAWQRLTEVKPNEDSGGLFRRSRPEVKRMREMLRTINDLPGSCRDVGAVSRGADFKNWQSHVVSIAKIRHKEKLNGLISKGRLQPYLRGSITHLKFSPDGRYLIAQDASGLNILSREPLKFLFRINIDAAKFGNFSPDSRYVIIQTYGLRVEVWDVESRRAVTTREVYVRDACGQTSLSPDGKTLVCYTVAGDLHVIDVDTSEKRFSKTDFFRPSMFTRDIWMASFAGRAEVETLSIRFTPDSRYLVVGTIFEPLIISDFVSSPFVVFSQFRFGEKAAISFDLKDGKELKLPDGVKDLVSRPFTFSSNDTIVGQSRPDGEKSGTFSFPRGEKLEKFDLYGRSLEATTSANYVIVRPVGPDAAGVFSLPLKKFVLGNKSRAIDAHGDVFAIEGLNGTIELVKIVSNDRMETVATTVLPRNELGDVQTVAVSDKLDRLALSVLNRGAVFDLSNGARKIHIRGFRGSYVDSEGKIFADFPKFETEERSMVHLDFSAGVGKALPVPPKRTSSQIGRFMVRFQPEWYLKEMAEEDRKIKSSPDSKTAMRFKFPVLGGTEPWVLEVSEASTGNVLWSRKCGGSTGYAFAPDGETVSLWWPVASEDAREIIRKSPGLAEKARKLGEKQGDYLIQILNASTGNVQGHVFIETGEGSFRLKRTVAAGDWLTVVDSENRVLFYSIKSGELKRRMFGEAARVNPVSSIAVVENFPGVLSVENLLTQKKVGELRFPSSVLFLKFTADGSRLFILTANQEFYILDAARLADSE